MITSRNPRGGEPRAAVVAEQVVFDDYTFEVVAADGGWDWYVYRRAGELVGRGFRSSRPEAMTSAKQSIGQRRRQDAQQLQKELAAQRAIFAALKPLQQHERERVIAWVAARFELEALKPERST